ncbi:MAG: hypothetical protein PHP00_02270 [Thiotrichaceae bacterium]|nr:hypothetical protein [Thiotrichaceae bacterium]
MTYSIFLGTPNNRAEQHLLELDEHSHQYIFERNKLLIKHDSRLHRMSDYYKDVVFFYEDISILHLELCKLIQHSSDKSFIEILEPMKEACVAAITDNKNIYGFCD